MASGSYDNTIKLWDVKTRELITTLEGHQDWVFSLAFSPNGNILLSASNDKTIRIWQING